MQLLSAEGRALHGLLWRLTQRADVAEDLMQDLVIKLADSATFSRADRPAAFARRAATNLALDWRRKQKRRGLAADWSTVQHTRAADSPGPVSVLEQDDEIARLLDALAQMKPTDRVVLTMRYLEEADYDAVAAAVGKTAAQARGLCFKAVRRLRKQLTKIETVEVRHGA
ncbi:MAG: sigma-70 family RNA polymerase sigma factor [Planctomycetota bacterium]